MGVAGVAMLGAVYALIKFIITIIKIPVWKKKGVYGKGIIGDLINTETKYKNNRQTRIESITYTYNLKIHCGNQIIEDEYKEYVSGDKDSDIGFGEEFELYWDDNNKEYYNYTQDKKGLTMYPIIFGACSVIIAICFLIVTSLR